MTLATLGYVGYAVESTEGTFVAPTLFLPVTSFNFDDSNDYITPDQIRRSRDRSIALAGPYSTSGSIDMELVPNGISALLRSAFAAAKNGTGVVTSAGGYAGSYSHVFKPGNVSPTFTFEGSAGEVLIRRYGGIRVNNMEISASFGEIVTTSFGLEGTTRGTTTNAASEEFAQVVPFHFDGAKIQRKLPNGSYADVANVKSFTFGVNNNIDRMGTLQRTRAYRRTVLGMRDVSLSMTLDFDTPADYNLFLDETEFSVILDLRGGLIGGSTYHSLVIEIPRVRYNMTSVPISGNSYIEQSVDCQILRPLDGTTDIFTATLVNTESSVPGEAAP